MVVLQVLGVAVQTFAAELVSRFGCGLVDLAVGVEIETPLADVQVGADVADLVDLTVGVEVETPLAYWDRGLPAGERAVP